MVHAELKEYDAILNEHGNEWDMLAWASGAKVCSRCIHSMTHLLHFAVPSLLCARFQPRSPPRQALPEYLQESKVMQLLMDFTRNETRQQRLQMPSLK